MPVFGLHPKAITLSRLVTSLYSARVPSLANPHRKISHFYNNHPQTTSPRKLKTYSVSDFPTSRYTNNISGGFHSPAMEKTTFDGENNNRVFQSSTESGKRQRLPEELLSGVDVLTCDSVAEGGTCDVYLLGTSHVSTESRNQVQAIVSFLKPQVVFLELCPSRQDFLTLQKVKVPTVREMVDTWKIKHNILHVLYTRFLAQLAGILEIVPGYEFRVAYEEAMKYGGRVELGDRPIEITLERTWAMMPLRHKVKLLYFLLLRPLSFLPSPWDLKKMVKEMKDDDMITIVVRQMSKKFPTVMQTLVHERDQYMAASLLKVARETSSVVAVVGMGHLSGIKNSWKQPVSLEDLLERPSRSRRRSFTKKILISLGAAVAGVAVFSGIYLSGKVSHLLR